MEGGASALLAASVFHFAEFSIKDVKEYLNNKNIGQKVMRKKDEENFL